MMWPASGRRYGGAAGGTVTTDFETSDYDVEVAITLNLSFQPVEQIAFKFGNLAATQASHVYVVALRASFIEMLLPLHVH